MTIAADWHVMVSVTANIKAEFGNISRVTSSTGAAKRTNAKFLIACGMQLITILVMLTRALINKPLIALSAHTAHGKTSSTSAQS